MEINDLIRQLNIIRQFHLKNKKSLLAIDKMIEYWTNWCLERNCLDVDLEVE